VIRNSLFVVFLSTGLAGACATNPEPPGVWREVELTAPSDRVLWQLSHLSLSKMDFPRGAVNDPASGTIQTGWRTRLHPFQGEGYRERAEIQIRPVESGSWMVRTRVGKQINEALLNPLDPSRAEWKWTRDDRNTAAILLMHIRSLLEPELRFQEAVDPLDEIMKRAEGTP
jgi:hypothetical protein